MIGSNRPIRTTAAKSFLDTNGKTYTRKEQSIFAINSTKIANDLMKLHIHPRKSWTAEWPTDYPEEFMHHYVRGFFDGDGSIHLIKHPSQASKYIGVNFCGPEQYLLGLKAVLERVIGKPYGYMRPIKVKGGVYYQLVYSGAATIKKMMDWMYKDSTQETRLKRKHHIYTEFFKRFDGVELKQNDIQNPSKKVTEKWLITAFDEEKSISEWADDERCVVNRQTLYYRIINLEMNPEDALTIESGEVESVNHAADVPSNRATLSWANVKEIRQLKQSENLTNEAIAGKLGISVYIVNDIVRGRTWKDDAYEAPDTNAYAAKYYEYDGKSRTLTELATLTGVPKQTIDRRLRSGMTIEDAVNAERKKPEAYNRPTSVTGLTAEKVFEIREDYRNGLRGKTVMEKYDLTKSRYMDIVLNRTWKSDAVWWKEYSSATP